MSILCKANTRKCLIQLGALKKICFNYLIPLHLKLQFITQVACSKSIKTIVLYSIAAVKARIFLAHINSAI